MAERDSLLIQYEDYEFGRVIRADGASWSDGNQVVPGIGTQKGASHAS
jgi:hypothetical protein